MVYVSRYRNGYLGKNFNSQVRTLIHVINRIHLKKFEFYSQIFLWVLTEIVNQLGAFGSNLIDVRRGLVDVVVKRFVGQKFSDCPFAASGVVEN